MKTIKNIIRVLICDFFIAFRILFGNNIRINPISLVSPVSSIRTFERGIIIVGKKSIIRPNTEITSRNGSIIIGNNCFINRNCMVVSHSSIIISNNVSIGPGTMIYDHNHDGNGGYDCSPITICKNVWIGSGCIILKGVVIGENSIIGAGSVITKDVPPHSVIYQKRQTTIRKDKRN